jgi:hypothetical protein
MQLPDFDKAFDYENNFYLSSDISRMGKVLAHYELYKMTQDLPGAIVECGVFKGASFVRFAAFRELFGSPLSKQLIGFDTFADFPETKFEADIKPRERHVEGGKAISKGDLLKVLEHKRVDRFVELVEGDVTKTVPAYVKEHPELKISLLNLDTDIYEPAVTILEHLYPRLVPGGILILDDYAAFPGETKAADEFFRNTKTKIRHFPFALTPSYVIKE